MNAKEDNGHFVYALPRNRNDKKARYNPYDLQVVSANAARSCKLYWTASASNITRVSGLSLPTLVLLSMPISLKIIAKLTHYNFHYNI